MGLGVFINIDWRTKYQQAYCFKMDPGVDCGPPFESHWCRPSDYTSLSGFGHDHKFKHIKQLKT